MDELKPESPHGPKIKVVDRRKFTASGEPVEPSSRADEPLGSASPPEQVPVMPAQEDQPPRAEVPPTTKKGPPPTLFLELVTMLASQAELLLVGADDFPAQPADAQRMIDYLGALESKTKGNLSADEARILSTVLYQLRTSFLQRK